MAYPATTQVSRLLPKTISGYLAAIIFSISSSSS